MDNNKFVCPECGKTIIEKNLKNITEADDLVIKSRLVFLNNNGEILCRCLECKHLTTLPLNFLPNNLSIQQTAVVDL
jgi:hypothetical protein